MAPPSFTSMSRRGLLVGAAAVLGASAAPVAAQALNLATARALIDSAVGDVNRIIASGKSESAMFVEFEKLFVKYADVPVIARSALGPAARQASAGDLRAFTKAFQGYISRKYGRRFREFIGGRIEVVDAKPLKSYFEVISTAYLQGEAPFDVRWHVSDKAGRPLFFNLIIEGVNLLASERQEIGAMLDRRRGDIGALVADLNAS